MIRIGTAPLVAAAFGLVACSGGGSPADQPVPATPAPGSAATSAAAPATAVTQPPADAGFDYQIGEAYPPPDDVGIVTRDRSQDPAAGRYNVCYVNAFQTQPDEAGLWDGDRADLLLRRDGAPVVDGEWGEVLLDISTGERRDRLVGIVGEWFAGCARRGYQAVEPDNLDSWTRSGGLLTRADAIAYADSLAEVAHRLGLAIGQKNALELGEAGPDAVGFDFAIAEECAAWLLDDGRTECEGYTDLYGDRVLVVEYDADSFALACATVGGRLPVVLRNRLVTGPSDPEYVDETC